MHKTTLVSCDSMHPTGFPLITCIRLDSVSNGSNACTHLPMIELLPLNVNKKPASPGCWQNNEEQTVSLVKKPLVHPAVDGRNHHCIESE
ncbi:hypothetical protein CEXT_770471 [Caerostris extrusa]|uniref:Uncharacterized protein n=1 Tax=Caerostris extrusa TaxID=172846 RepID=A0AAV4VH88_CAEEX|nr:hypothetical protein CEXT_770471 [Caerostris extrusa]